MTNARPGSAGWARRIGAALALLAISIPGCGMLGSDRSMREAAALTGGDPRAAPEKMRDYGCASCHTIPGVVGADRLVGPPLTGIAQRMYIAGVLTNTPENLVRWIRDPPAVDPKTAMPNLGVTEQDARDIAAYLYTLE